MVRRCGVLAFGMLFVFGAIAHAQDDAGSALAKVLFGSNAQGALDLDVVVAAAYVLSEESSTFPLASSSGGFTWTFDPKLGVQTRRTQSFGPMFAERPFTNGAQKFNVGIAFQHTAFDSLAGQSLSGLTTVSNPTSRPAPFFLTKTYTSSLAFKTDRTIISASYGVTDRVDVGVLVPIEHTTASGSSSSTATLLDIPAGQCAVAATPDGRLTSPLCRPTNAGTGPVVVPEGICTVSVSGFLTCPFSENNIKGTSSGLGDVIIRGKVAIVSMPTMDLGAGIDLRLPTGDFQGKLLGIGKTQAKIMLMGSSTLGSVAPHFNVGYTFSSGDGLPVDSSGHIDTSKLIDDSTGNLLAYPSKEVNYVFGADVAAAESVTVMFDVIGRSLRNSATFDYTSGNSSSFTATPGTLNLLLGTVGTKIKIGGEFLITASVVFPLNSAGIKPGVTPVVGFERAF